MSAPTFDVYLDGSILTHYLGAALDALDAALAQLSAKIGIVRDITPHATGALIRFTDSTTTHYLIAPHDTDDLSAWGALIQARLRRHWPTAAFALRPVGPWAHAQHVRVSWTDGPTPVDVNLFMGFHLLNPFDLWTRHRDRGYSPAAYDTVAALADTAAQIKVPRTADGDIDWVTASTLVPDPSPVNIAGLVFDTADEPPLTVAEILRGLARHVDLAHITASTAAQITAPTPRVTDPHAGSPIKLTLPDSTTATVVGYLAVEDTAPLTPGTPVAALAPQLAADSIEPQFALVESGDWEILTITADGIVTRRYPGDAATPTRWSLYPVDRVADGYALTHRPVTAAVAPLDITAQLRGVFVDGPTTISEVFG
ncbi:hypothetical protein [Nocardia asteroides]